MFGFRILTLGALLLLVLSGCMGDDADDEPSETIQPGPSSPVPEQTPSAEVATTPTVAPTADIAATAQAAACAVTSPSEQTPSRWIGNPVQQVWYEDAELWVSPVSYSGANPALFDEDPGEWFAGSSRLTVVAPNWDDTIEISGRSMDEQAGTVEFIVEGSHPDFGTTGVLSIPEPGCWDLMISAGDQTFPLTIYALPFEERADVAWALGTRDTIQAGLHPIPTPCVVTEPTLASPDAVAHYWLYGDGIEVVFDPPGIFWAGEEVGTLWYPETWGDLELSGQLQEDPSITLRSSLMQQTSRQGERWAATLVFPAPGCWELTGRTLEGTLEATIYVYPSECRHEAGEPLPDTCQAPSTS